MAYGYWALNMHERESVFHLIFRNQPFQSNYSVACGLGTVIDFIQQWHIPAEDLQYLQGLSAPDGSPLFSIAFLDYLAALRLTIDLDAILEGTVVFPQEPLVQVRGPLLQCQLLESTLLNSINFQTLIATKAARVCQAAGGDAVIEFGLRRAQGPDGALSASRAAFIGGCTATSNVLAGKNYGIPVSGTHAHSWVTAFSDELAAFSAYADVMPHQCVLLVDTYDTLQGVKNAITVGQQLKKKGGVLRAIRLDSGDMAALSIAARDLLDAAGFYETQIIASNSLDETIIQQLKEKGAKISIWGVGTQLVTAYDHPALDGVYKLSALRDEENNWVYKLKLSEEQVKISNPGIHQVRRYWRNKQPVMDVMYDLEMDIVSKPDVVSVDQPHLEMQLPVFDEFTDLLQPIFRQGQLVHPVESMQAMQERAKRQVHPFINQPESAGYPVGLESHLYQLKKELMANVG